MKKSPITLIFTYLKTTDDKVTLPCQHNLLEAQTKEVNL